jgi:cytoskeletal protein CcmA (bactofilin family)
MSFFSSRRQGDNPPPSSAAGRIQSAQTLPAPSQPVGFDTVLGANTVLEGVLRSGSNVRLDGTFTGTLEINGNVLVGETAKINADINAKNISIAGAVRGNVTGKKVQLLRTGRIWGDIHAQALTTEEGAFIDGKITMIGKDDEAAVSAQSTQEASAEASSQSPAVKSSETADDSDPTSAEVTSVEVTPDAPPTESPETEKPTEQE